MWYIINAKDKYLAGQLEIFFEKFIMENLIDIYNLLPHEIQKLMIRFANVLGVIERNLNLLKIKRKLLYVHL